MPALRLIQLGKRFGTVSALDGVSLEAGEGELVVVTGPSGSGKSTLLRLLAGLETVSHGEIHYGAERFDTLLPERRGVALVSQNPALLPQLSVAGNLGLGLRLRKVERAEAERRVGEAAERLGLSDLLCRLPAELSGGEQQRVALGRALVSRPKLLLLDEPLAQLDPALKRGLRREIHRLQRELNVPALLVTHDQEEAMELADRIAVLRGGRLEQMGSPEQVHRSPVNPFVAEFFSPTGINRLEGQIEDNGQGTWFQTDGLRLRMPASLIASETTGRRLLFVRPESIRVFPAQGSDTGVMVRPELEDGTALESTVTHVVRLGWEQRIELEAGGRTWSARTTESVPLVVGQTVRWAIRWTEALWFDAGY